LEVLVSEDSEVLEVGDSAVALGEDLGAVVQVAAEQEVVGKIVSC
jgi:S1-C subfamily serine protease